MKRIRAILLANATVFTIVKNITEIIALLIAATWAIYNFKLKEAPALEESALSYCELHIEPLNEKKNLVNYIVHLKNNGKSSFDVDSVVISYWIVPLDTMLQNSFFSAAKYMEHKRATYSITDSAFSFHYPPSKECIERYNFFVNKDPNSAILLKANFFLEGENGFISRKYFW